MSEPARPSSTPTPEGRGPRFHTFTALKHRNFRYLWLSTVLASSGQNLHLISVGWLVFLLTDSPLMVAMIGGARTLPYAFVGPLGGLVADRIDRRRLLLLMYAFLAVISCIFATLVLLEQVQWWHVLVYSLVMGSVWAFNQPVRLSLIANSVPERDLPTAVSLDVAAVNFNSILSPLLGGILIATLGIAGNFFLQGGAYIGVILLARHLRLPAQSSKAVAASPLRNLTEGLKYVWYSPALVSVILLAIVTTLFVLPTMRLMPIFAVEVLSAGPKGLGVLLAAFGLGTLLSSITLASLGNFRRKGLYLTVVALLVGMVMVAFAHSPWFSLSVGVLILMGFCYMGFRSISITLIQLHTSDLMRARVISLFYVNHGLEFVGSLLIGLLAEFHGAPYATTLFGIAAIAVAVILLVRFPRLSRLR